MTDAFTAPYTRRPIQVEISDPVASANSVLIARWTSGTIHYAPGREPWLIAFDNQGVRTTVQVDKGWRVARGFHNEFYPVSPEAFESGFDPSVHTPSDTEARMHSPTWYSGYDTGYTEGWKAAMQQSNPPEHRPIQNHSTNLPT